jgi:hypothetical protein
MESPLKETSGRQPRVDHEIVVITTRFSGLYFLNIRTSKLDHYTHDPLDPGSIGGNNTFNVMVDKYGYLFVTTQTSGLHYCNLLHAQVAMKPYFSDANKQIFDGYIQAVTLQGDSIVWLGAQDRLIKWNRYRNKSQFVSIRLPDGQNLLGRETIRSLIDRSQWPPLGWHYQIWHLRPGSITQCELQHLQRRECQISHSFQLDQPNL